MLSKSDAFQVDDTDGGGHWYGMTLRDYFATKAMQAYCQCHGGECRCDLIASDAYEMADAMLKERLK